MNKVKDKQADLTHVSVSHIYPLIKELFWMFSIFPLLPKDLKNISVHIQK